MNKTYFTQHTHKCYIINVGDMFEHGPCKTAEDAVKFAESYNCYQQYTVVSVEGVRDDNSDARDIIAFGVYSDPLTLEDGDTIYQVNWIDNDLEKSPV